MTLIKCVSENAHSDLHVVCLAQGRGAINTSVLGFMLPLMELRAALAIVKQ